MCRIPFLKDALYLGPETEAVQKFLEGFPREIIWLESLRLEVKGKDCAVRNGKERKKEACWSQGHFDPGHIQPFFPLCVFLYLSSRGRQRMTTAREMLTVQFAQFHPLAQRKKKLTTK